MAYRFYINHILLPIPPENIKYSIGSKNNVVNIVDDTDYNFLRKASLTEISFEVIIPAVKYPFAMYEGVFLPQSYFLDIFKNFKDSKKPLRLFIAREFPDGKKMYDTHFNSVSLESYDITESAENGFDIIVSFLFKEYIDVKTTVITVNSEGDINEEVIREVENSPKPVIQSKTHTVKKGDSLWNIAKYYYGDGSKYKIIADANSDIISNPNKISIGQVIVIPNI